MKKDDLKSKIYKQVMMFPPDKKSNTGAIVMPLNVDISDKAEKVVEYLWTLSKWLLRRAATWQNELLPVPRRAELPGLSPRCGVHISRRRRQTGRKKRSGKAVYL